MRTQAEVTLPLRVERDAPAPLPDQLVTQLRGLLAEGVLAPGDQLPSTRTLAAHLGVSRGTVVSAYDQLTAEGWFTGTPGSATRVNPRLDEVHPSSSRPAAERPGAGPVGGPQFRPSRGPDATEGRPGAPGPEREDAGGPVDALRGRAAAGAGQTRGSSRPDGAAHAWPPPEVPDVPGVWHARHGATPAARPRREPLSLRHPVIDLRPGQPMQSGVVGPAWRAAWRRAGDAPVDVPMPALGWPPLRAAIADHLRRMRALVREPEDVCVTAGGREGLALLLLATGARSVGVEDPGYPSLRRVLGRLGVEVRSLPADAHGLITGDLPRPAPDLVLVTPSHQYPLGGSLPIERRRQLLAWADATDTLLVEDDYDSELRYTSAPLPALTSLDAEGRVVLLGTFSKTLTPALGAGYLVLPPRLLDAVVAARLDLGSPVNLVTQRALADLLASGALRRHTQRMRHLYKRRRAQVVAALRGLDGVRVYPMDGGLHTVVEHGGDEASVIAAIAAAGVLVSPLSEYWAGGGSRRGLVFGFGGVPDAALAAGLDAIRAALGGGPTLGPDAAPPPCPTAG